MDDEKAQDPQDATESPAARTQRLYERAARETGPRILLDYPGDQSLGRLRCSLDNMLCELPPGAVVTIDTAGLGRAVGEVLEAEMKGYGTRLRFERIARSRETFTSTLDPRGIEKRTRVLIGEDGTFRGVEADPPPLRVREAHDYPDSHRVGVSVDDALRRMTEADKRLGGPTPPIESGVAMREIQLYERVERAIGEIESLTRVALSNALVDGSRGQVRQLAAVLVALGQRAS